MLQSARWDGKRLERAAAISVFGADEAYSVTEVDILDGSS